ncbi:MAG: diguanylate cyclase domain-containing protein [Succinivibrio sp.]
MSTTSLEDFFDNIGEIVYMSDPESFELVYINKCGRRKLGLKPATKLSKIKCYEIMHDDPYVSEGYDPAKLKIGEFLEFDYYDPVTSSYYERKVTLVNTEKHGRVRLEIDINFDDRGNDLNLVNELTSYVRVTNQAMVRALLTDNPDASINDMLSYLGESFECDRAYIFEFTGDACNNTYEWCRPGVSPQLANLQNVPNSVLRSWNGEFLSGTNVIINDIEQYKKKDPVIYAVLKPQAINSLVVGPIFENRRLLGFYGVDNPPSYRTSNISTTFKVLSHFMAVLIRNRNNVRKLTNYSYFDQMTGVCNRHGLDRQLKTRDKDKALGLVLCDLNGLKKLNDSKGHIEGDHLILKLSKLLAERFGDEMVFRMGGDEFLVMRDGGTQEQLAATVADLKERFAKAGISVSVGSVWKAPGEATFDKAYDAVDAAMYKDKRAFYGERRRRPWPEEKGEQCQKKEP